MSRLTGASILKIGKLVLGTFRSVIKGVEASSDEWSGIAEGMMKF